MYVKVVNNSELGWKLIFLAKLTQRTSEKFRFEESINWTELNRSKPIDDSAVSAAWQPAAIDVHWLSQQSKVRRPWKVKLGKILGLLAARSFSQSDYFNIRVIVGVAVGLR